MNKKTLVLGASTKIDRYSNIAVRKLNNYGHDVVSVGRKTGEIAGITIESGQPSFEDVHTVTLYLNPNNQKEYYDYIFNLNPKRIIFNPGTENKELITLAKKKGVEVEIACTLVMLSVGNY